MFHPLWCGECAHSGTVCTGMANREAVVMMASSLDVFMDDVRELIENGDIQGALSEVRLEIDILTREIVALKNAQWERGN